MYRQVNDFLNDWSLAAKGTTLVMQAMTDDKLDQSIVEGHSSLGWLGWHLVVTTGFFSNLAGLPVPMVEKDAPTPTSAADIVAAYKNVAKCVEEEVAKLSDEDLQEVVKGINGPMARGKLLHILIDHQTHHRGQMTVLLRQAGLPVPGIMGPTKEMQ